MILHNRLTHSLKVEQVGLSLFSKLGGKSALGGAAEEFAIAAACLAHDLGHPPFGHAGEEELNSLLTCRDHRRAARSYGQRRAARCGHCKLEDGFEGNAQSFRILTALATHKDPKEFVGLDLTHATLSAVTKYPWLRGENADKQGKWGAYDCDASALWETTGQDGGSPWGGQGIGQSLAAQIMDWADDISYAVHDIEDFFRTRHIPLDNYTRNSDTVARFVDYAAQRVPLTEELKTALRDLMTTFFPKREFEGTVENHTELEKMRGRLLTEFINGTTIVDGSLVIDDVQQTLNSALKQLTWFHVIEGPALTNIQTGQRRVLREIFKSLAKPALDAYEVRAGTTPDPRKLRKLPAALTRAVDVAIHQMENSHDPVRYDLQACVYRGLTDFIAGLSDADAYDQHAVLKGRPAHGHL